jgi:hypothetical protein
LSRRSGRTHRRVEALTAQPGPKKRQALRREGHRYGVGMPTELFPQIQTMCYE